MGNKKAKNRRKKAENRQVEDNRKEVDDHNKDSVPKKEDTTKKHALPTTGMLEFNTLPGNLNWLMALNMPPWNWAS